VLGTLISGGSITTITQVIAFGTGSGGPGTYIVSPSQTVGSTSITALITQFQEVSFEQPIVGPPPLDWSVVPATNNARFQSTTSGWYLMTYKLDIRTNGSAASFTKAAASLMQLVGSDWQEVTGSSSTAQAPDTIHLYSVSNTVLVQYSAGNQIALQWWAGLYGGATPVLLTSTTGLSIGPNNTTAPEIPWVPASHNPDGSMYSPFNEAIASLVITRIIKT
jgi:hypothetical protein